MSLLDIEGISVSFRTDQGRVLAVRGLSLSVAPNEVVGVVGESGSGKSVSALSILGLLPRGRSEISGAIRFEGENILGWPERRLRKLRGGAIAMVFQEPMTSLNPVLSIGWQIGEVLRLHRGLARHEARREAVELLRVVGLPDPEGMIEAYPHQLSGGQRQRVMIAIALAGRPRLLIADEPTTALDVTIQAQILDLLRALQARFGMAMLLITHDLGVMAEMAARVVVMYGGEKVEEAPTARLFASPRHPYTAGLLGAIPRLSPERRDALVEIPGTVPVVHAPPAGCIFAPRCARADERCRSVPPSFAWQAPGVGVACHHPLGEG